MGEVLLGLVPTAGVVFLFWLVVRAFFQADRREREAQARLDREEARKRGGTPPDGG